MELRHYISLVWKWMWLIVLAASISACVSFLWNLRLPKIYQTSTTLLVGRNLENPNPNSGDINTSQQLARSYIQLAKTDSVLRAVIDALKIPATTDQLRNNVNAWIIEGTQLIQLSVMDTDPRRAQAIANEYAFQLIAQTPTGRDPAEVARLEFVQKQVDDIQARIEDNKKKIADLQKSITATSSARDIADKQSQITTLQTEINQMQVTYATLLSTLAPRASNYLSVVDPARLATDPVAPNIPLSVATATLIGVALAILGAILIEYLDDTIKSPDDVSQVLGLANLGAIANIWGDIPEEKLITMKFPRASHSEAYRTIRTNIQVMSLDRPLRTLLVTSANPREGKSITAANLSVVMALGGLRVLLIDADMRRPQQHKIFHLPNEFGLVSALLHPEAGLDTYLQPTGTENLSLLSTGPIPPNPAELLDSKRMHDLLDRFKSQFDLIVIDTPPVLPRVDAAILAQHIDGVVIVADANQTRRESAVRTKEALMHVGANILGVVLNRISHSGSYYYYYYYSDDNKKKASIFRRTQIGRVLTQLMRRWGLIKDDSMVESPSHGHRLG